MKKIYTRIAACFMAALLTFNIFAVPQAKASTTITMLAPAVLAAYAESVGVSLAATSAGAVSSGTAAAIGGYAAATGTTGAAVSGAIVGGTAITVAGSIILTAAAIAVLAGIIGWVISECQLEPGCDPVPVYTEFDYMINGKPLIAPDRLTDYSAYAVPYSSTPYDISNAGAFSINAASNGYVMVYWQRADTDSVSSTNVGTWSSKDVHTSDLGFTALFDEHMGCVFYAVKEDGSLGTEPIYWGYAGFGVDFSAVDGLAVSLDTGYKSPPDVPEDRTMVIDAGLTATDEQGIVDAILSGIAASTFAPTYTIEVNTGGDAGSEGGNDSGKTEDEKQTGFLGRIANGIDGLAESIKDSIGSIFIPDAALTAEITNTFSEKFSFVSDLHRLGTDLLNLEPYTEPPVVYIHLEDAEGTINYGGTVKALDMSWYERYKPDGDRIIGGFLWLGFLWSCFMRTADIINGAGMIYATFPEEGPSINLEYDDTPRLPAPRKRPRGRVR